MKQTNKVISDEQLAAYLEGSLSEFENELVERNMDVDTLEVLSVSQKAMRNILCGDDIFTLDYNLSVAGANVHPGFNCCDCISSIPEDPLCDDSNCEELDQESLDDIYRKSFLKFRNRINLKS